jgi:hypothetical protein
MSIVFLGDKPSRKNINPNIPFVGTTSYKKLLDWIYRMNIDITKVVLKNTTCDNVYWVCRYPGNKVIALGRSAEKYCKKNDIKCFYLPHPSGANLKANPGRDLDRMLKECEKYANGV